MAKKENKLWDNHTEMLVWHKLFRYRKQRNTERKRVKLQNKKRREK